MQVVGNLADNAIKYTPSGGRVAVVAWARRGDVGVTVEDSGPGIPESARERIFERFFRLDTARARDGGGSGLGLSICKEIVLAHGGRIWVESEERGGSAFTFSLPATDAPVAPQPPEPLTSKSSSSPPRTVLSATSPTPRT